MFLAQNHNSAVNTKHLDDSRYVDPLQWSAFAVAIVVSVMAGVAAFTFLSATHPNEHRVTWVLQPPKSKTAARAVAPANQLAAHAVPRRSRDM